MQSVWYLLGSKDKQSQMPHNRPPPSFLSRSSSPLGSLLTRSSPLAGPRPRWQRRRIIQHSRSKNTPALQATQHNFQSRQLCCLGQIFWPSSHVLCFVSWDKRIEKMPITLWSEVLNCDSALSKHVRAYSAPPLNPSVSVLSNVEKVFHCSSLIN